MKIKKLAVMFMISAMFITSVAPVCAATKPEKLTSDTETRDLDKMTDEEYKEYYKKKTEESSKIIDDIWAEYGRDPSKATVGGDDEEVTYKLSKSKLSLEAGKTKTIKVSPDYSGTIKWTTSDKTIATVSSKGKIKAVKAGTCTIAAKLSDGTKLKCKLTVTKKTETTKKKEETKKQSKADRANSVIDQEALQKAQEIIDRLGITGIGAE